MDVNSPFHKYFYILMAIFIAEVLIGLIGVLRILFNDKSKEEKVSINWISPVRLKSAGLIADILSLLLIVSLVSNHLENRRKIELQTASDKLKINDIDVRTKSAIYFNEQCSEFKETAKPEYGHPGCSQAEYLKSNKGIIAYKAYYPKVKSAAKFYGYKIDSLNSLNNALLDGLAYENAVEKFSKTSQIKIFVDESSLLIVIIASFAGLLKLYKSIGEIYIEATNRRRKLKQGGPVAAN